MGSSPEMMLDAIVRSGMFINFDIEAWKWCENVFRRAMSSCDNKNRALSTTYFMLHLGKSKCYCKQEIAIKLLNLHQVIIVNGRLISEAKKRLWSFPFSWIACRPCLRTQNGSEIIVVGNIIVLKISYCGFAIIVLRSCGGATAWTPLGEWKWSLTVVERKKTIQTTPREIKTNDPSEMSEQTCVSRGN